MQLSGTLAGVETSPYYGAPLKQSRVCSLKKNIIFFVFHCGNEYFVIRMRRSFYMTFFYFSFYLHINGAQSDTWRILLPLRVTVAFTKNLDKDLVHKLQEPPLQVKFIEGLQCPVTVSLKTINCSPTIFHHTPCTCEDLAASANGVHVAEF